MSILASRRQLGKYTSINLSKKENAESWAIKYEADDSNFPTSSLGLERKVDRDGNINSLRLNIAEMYFDQGGNRFLHDIHITVRRTEADLLHIVTTVKEGHTENVSTKTISTTHASSGVTDTEVNWYRKGNTEKFLVMETQKVSKDGMSNAFTVGDYYANSTNNSSYSRTDIDIGLSVVAYIRVSSGNLSITVEGPESHPVQDLFDMFAAVFTTGNWNPTARPHCAEKFPPDESEDNVPRHGTQQNAPSRDVINERGTYHGDYSGSSIDRNNVTYNYYK